MADLVLGTVALGLPYGLPAANGTPPQLIDEADAAALIRRAFAAGIRTFDTAPAYGCAEERLGRALGAEGVVWTKLGHDGSWEGAEASLSASCRRLQRARIDLLQVHKWTPAIGARADFIAAWAAFGADPRVAALGCSTYGLDDALAAVRSGLFRVVQVEWNLLNQAVVDGVAAEAAACGVALAVRSVLLQGVLTSRGDVLPAHLASLAPARARIVDLAQEWGMPLAALALRAALDHPGISHVLIGLDGAVQLDEALAARDLLPLLPAQCETLAGCHVGGPATDPRTWGRS